MAIEMTCPGCNGRLKLEEAQAAKTVRCKHCGTVFEVARPEKAEEAAPAEEAKPAADTRVSGEKVRSRPPAPPKSGRSTPPRIRSRDDDDRRDQASSSGT